MDHLTENQCTWGTSYGTKLKTQGKDQPEAQVKDQPEAQAKDQPEAQAKDQPEAQVEPQMDHLTDNWAPNGST